MAGSGIYRKCDYISEAFCQGVFKQSSKIRSAPIPELTDRKKSRKLESKGAHAMEQKKTKKRTTPPRYDDAFKAGAVRLVTEQGRQPVEVAKEQIGRASCRERV